MHLESKKSKLFYKICADFSNLYIWKPAGIVKQALFYSKEVTTNIEKISIEAKTKNNWGLPVEIKNGFKIILYGSVNFI